VDDMAEACIFLIQQFNPTKEQNMHGEVFMNVGVGSDITVKKLAVLIKEATDYKGEITWDNSQPDGVFQKLLDSSKINKLGWKPIIDLKEGVRNTYEWYKRVKIDTV
jgi:GDP-L-fucose synthase